MDQLVIRDAQLPAEVDRHPHVAGREHLDLHTRLRRALEIPGQLMLHFGRQGMAGKGPEMVAKR